jgi:hypothetical protein
VPFNGQKIGQTVYRALSNDDLNALGEEIENYFIKLINTSVSPFDSLDSTPEGKQVTDDIMGYLDALFDGRDKDGKYKNNDFLRIYTSIVSAQ